MKRGAERSVGREESAAGNALMIPFEDSIGVRAAVLVFGRKGGAKTGHAGLRTVEQMFLWS